MASNCLDRSPAALLRRPKVAALKQVFTGPYDSETYPSQLIKPATGRITLLLDAAAAAALPPPGPGGVGKLEISR